NKLLFLIIGFLIPTTIFLIFNYFKYHDILLPFKSATYIIRNAGTWIFTKPWYFYFENIFLENYFYIFFILGFFVLIILLIKSYKKNQFHNESVINKLSILVIIILGLTYFIWLPHKEMRFMILLLPFLAIVTALGISTIINKLKRINKISSIIFTIIMILLLIFPIIKCFNINEQPIDNQEYVKYLHDKSPMGEILVGYPTINLYINKNVHLIYFPVYNSTLAEYYTNYILINKDKIEYFFFDTCLGGTICPPHDTNCHPQTQKLIETLDNNYNLTYFKQIGSCNYYIYKNLLYIQK
ncbi:hypothetical protein ACFL1H_00065, partial [Nanoarchaeota archaeon]